MNDPQKYETVLKWIDHMNGTKRDPRLTQKGVGLGRSCCDCSHRQNSISQSEYLVFAILFFILVLLSIS